ncbi:S9 family peptidase [Marivirga sp. S37H4]|uniref:S9 family peptidase n=1 Tax=Marivirga aurantiaca TaxID=2802615 RepID=A0A934WUX8_9BACT|nr:S9 family peptidase [Marivirga aurantiaca]MBK6263493.1 S9 family peptidase [Marivirga aurantiaca]
MQNIRRWQILFLLLLISYSGFAQEKQTFSSFQEAMVGLRPLNGDSGPGNVNWINDGQAYSFTERNEEGAQLIKTFNPKTNEEKLVFSTEGLTIPNSEEAFNYVSFQWSDDSQYLLFQVNFRPVWRRSGISDYYYYSIADKTLDLVAKDAQTAELSPNGKKVGYERGGNLFIFDLADRKETQLTDDAEDGFYNGRFGWAYEEEFGLAQAWEWSHDSEYIAFWQSDEREVPIFQMTDYEGTHKEWVKLPYPQVGDKNPTVKIGVINVAKNSKEWMNVPLNDGYIPRIYWTAEKAKLAVMQMNRAQTEMRIYMTDANSGKADMIFEETSDAWIDVFDFFAGIMHYAFFPKDTKEFFWITDKGGYAHLYRYDYNGKLLNQVTSGDYEVVFVHAVDSKKKKIYYSSTEDSPLERQLYVVNFNGKGKKKLTELEGRHNIDMSPEATYYIDRFSNVNTPPKVELRNAPGKLVKTLEENQSVNEALSGVHFVKPELSQFTNRSGDKIDISIYKPVGFDAKEKYPMVIDVYGGPGAQSVYNQWSVSAWHQYLAHNGYVVIQVNNRGGGGYGREFEKIVYKNLGHAEGEDFADAAKHMAELGYVDADKIGIRGHSYGGYMSSFAILNHPDVFEVALVGAPVTDWRLYDSIYAERYMGLNEDNEEGYINSSSTTYAKNLEGHIFIAHSTMDENVHVQNTFQLVKALIDNGKDHDLKIFPPGAHGVAYNYPSYLLLMNNYINYLDRYLK